MRAQGYPLAKAQAYERLRNPFMLNDLAMAPLLLDRRDVYTRLRSIGVPTPHNAFLSRDGWRGTEPSAQTLVEHDDYIEVNGEVRPIETPTLAVSATDLRWCCGAGGSDKHASRPAARWSGCAGEPSLGSVVNAGSDAAVNRSRSGSDESLVSSRS